MRRGALGLFASSVLNRAHCLGKLDRQVKLPKTRFGRTHFAQHPPLVTDKHAVTSNAFVPVLAVLVAEVFWPVTRPDTWDSLD